MQNVRGYGPYLILVDLTGVLHHAPKLLHRPQTHVYTVTSVGIAIVTDRDEQIEARFCVTHCLPTSKASIVHSSDPCASWPQPRPGGIRQSHYKYQM